jgi:hypothetical protein
METIIVYVLTRRVYSSAFHGDNVIMHVTTDLDAAREWAKQPNQTYEKHNVK